MLTPLRRYYGLRWQSDTPKPDELGFDAKNIAYLIALFLLYGLAGSIDYATEKAIEAERKSESYALQQTALLTCLNGGAPGYYTTDAAGHRHYIVCETYTVSDENTKQKRSM